MLPAPTSPPSPSSPGRGMGSLAVIVFGRVSWSRPRQRHDRASGILFPGDKRSGGATDRSIDKRSLRSIVSRGIELHGPSRTGRSRGLLLDHEDGRTILSATPCAYRSITLRSITNYPDTAGSRLSGSLARGNSLPINNSTAI